MKKIKSLFLLSLLVFLTACSEDYNDKALWSKVNSLSSRVTEIENMLTQFNSDIAAMNTLALASQNGLSVNNVVETAEGYKITYSNGQTFLLPSTTNGRTPYVGYNGNWWIDSTDTGVKAEGVDGESIYIRNGTWWIGDTNTGVSVVGTDGLTPRVGPNGQWWIGSKDTGIQATGRDGMTPYIGINGHWWLGSTDTGVSAYGSGDTEEITRDIPILTVELYTDGRYYWQQTLNGVKTWLLDSSGQMLPVTGNDAQKPIVRINVEGFWIISTNGGATWEYILDGGGQRVSFYTGCGCQSYFSYVKVIDKYLIIILSDGTVITIRLWGDDEDYDDDDEPGPPTPFYPPYDIVIPNPQPTVDDEYIVRMNVTGMQDPYTGDWLKLYGTRDPQQNTWLQLDGQYKYIRVENNSDEDSDPRVITDIVFIVDNSGTMSEEADAVARDIIAWSQSLQSSGLNVQFAIVGYDDSGNISGSIDFTDAETLSAYLNRTTGTSRTKGFGGSAASALQTAASSYSSFVRNECGALAIRFADSYLSFRNTANRIYINFTDEPNQPNGKSAYSVEFFASQTNWNPAQGTVHTVYSDPDISFTESLNYNEYPWKITDYTGGTKFFTNSSFTGVSLDALPVTGAMKNSYVIYFKIPASMLDGQPHQITLYVRTSDGSVRGMKTFSVVFTN